MTEVPCPECGATLEGPYEGRVACQACGCILIFEGDTVRIVRENHVKQIILGTKTQTRRNHNNAKARAQQKKEAAFNQLHGPPRPHSSSVGRAQLLKNRRKKRVNGKRKKLAHIVWHAHTGHWPVWPEVIHHKDFDKTNDAFENLQLMDAAEHAALHRSGQSHTKDSKAKMSKSWTPERKAKHSEFMTGKNNPSWKGADATPQSKYTRIWRARKKEQTMKPMAKRDEKQEAATGDGAGVLLFTPPTLAKILSSPTPYDHQITNHRRNKR